MKEQDLEKLSALVDNELDPFQSRRLVEQLLDDDELRQHWSDYHQVAELIQAGEHPAIGRSFSAQLSARLEQEEPVVAAHSPSAWLKPVASFALAASVAVVAILGVRGLTGSDEGNIATIAKTEPFVIERMVPAGVQLAADDELDVYRKREILNAYMVRHLGSSGRQLHGTPATARIVSYEMR